MLHIFTAADMKQIKPKTSKTEQVIDKLFNAMCKLDKVIGFLVLPTSFIFKYMNVCGASILILLISALLGIFYSVYKAILHPKKANILSSNLEFKTTKQLNQSTPSTAGTIASTFNP